MKSDMRCVGSVTLVGHLEMGLKRDALANWFRRDARRKHVRADVHGQDEVVGVDEWRGELRG